MEEAMIRPRPRFKLVPENRDAYHKVRMDQQALDDWEEDEQAERDQDALDAYDASVRRDVERKEKEEQQRLWDRKWNSLALVISIALFFGILFLALMRPACPIP
jgi:hypothetical protein